MNQLCWEDLEAVLAATDLKMICTFVRWRVSDCGMKPYPNAALFRWENSDGQVVFSKEYTRDHLDLLIQDFRSRNVPTPPEFSRAINMLAGP